MSRPLSFLTGSIPLILVVPALAQQLAVPPPQQSPINGSAQPIPQPLVYPAVPNALPPGLYRAGAMPIAPPAFYDLSPYYNSGYAPNGAYASGYGFGSYGYGFGQSNLSNYGVGAQRELARVPYQTATRDAQDYHYLNQIYKRDETLLQQNIAKTDSGKALFRAGQYEQAAIQLLDAADANHGDALSRVRAGHAMFAIGRYDQAVKLIARAFELQPGLATLRFDLREEYGNPQDFEVQFTAVERAVAAHPGDPYAITILGYARYYTSGPGSAFTALQTAKRLDPQNELIDKLLAVAGRLYSPNQPTAQRARSNSSQQTDQPAVVQQVRSKSRRI